jgi:hypothetical protein
MQGNAADSGGFFIRVNFARDCRPEMQMKRSDQELLDKQLRYLQLAPHNDGVLMLALTVAFFAGMAIGGFFYAYTGVPLRAVAEHAPPNQQVAANEVPIFIPQGNAARP